MEYCVDVTVNIMGIKISASTECVMDLDLQREIIILKSLLATFERSIIF